MCEWTIAATTLIALPASLPADHCADAHTPTRHSPERDLSRPRHAGYMPD
jgi:hypothetical protein